jgi:hypothetical protein
MNLDPVGTWVHLAEEEAAVWIALNSSYRPRIYIGSLDLSIEDHGPTLVRNRPRQGAACAALRKQTKNVNCS